MCSDDCSSDKGLPAVMWVVTRERTRTGRPPRRIVPRRLSNSFIVCDGPRGEVRYSATKCFDTLAAAQAALEALIKSEIAYEQAKFNGVRGKLLRAKKAAFSLSDTETADDDCDNGPHP